MSTYVYEVLNLPELIDKIEWNVSEVQSSLPFGILEGSEKINLVSNPNTNKIKWELQEQDNQNSQIVLEFPEHTPELTSEDEATSDLNINKIYRIIKCSGLPDNTNVTDKIYTFIISYVDGITKKSLKYKVIKQRQLIDIYITNCYYEWLKFNTCTCLKFVLSNDNNTNFSTSVFNKKTQEEIQLDDDTITNLIQFANNSENTISFEFINMPININKYFLIERQSLIPSNNVETNQGLLLNNSIYNVFFKFNNVSNIYKNFSYINFTFRENENYRYNFQPNNNLITKKNNLYYISLEIIENGTTISLINDNITKTYFDILKQFLSKDITQPIGQIEDKIIIKCCNFEINLLYNNRDGFGCSTSIEFYVNFDTDGNLKIVLDDNKFILNDNDNNTLYNFLNTYYSSDFNNIKIQITNISNWACFISYSNNQLYNINNYISPNPIQTQL